MTALGADLLVPGLTGKAVIVTGGASGIGRATALLAARSGASVIAGDVNDALLGELDKIAGDEGLALRGMHLDVTDAASVAEFVAAGDTDGNLFGVVNAAAITEFRPLLEVDLDFWNRVLTVNLTGTFLVCQAAAQAMIGRGGRGSIVNIASAAAVVGRSRMAPYAASKGGMVTLTKSVAQEWAPHGILVNCVSPGAVDTPIHGDDAERKRNYTTLTPLGRLGTPHDLAMSIAFLLSDLSPWTTGQNFNVNGGVVMA